MQIAPEIAVGDGALGFWKALDEVFPGTRHQRCRVHKTVNIVDKVPLSVQATMKKDLREVYWAPNRAAAELAIDVFAEKYRAKYSRAVECLAKDRDALLAFYDFPAEHWDHLRTTDEMAASVTGLPILSYRTEAPARRVLAAAASIATRIVRSFARPGRQSTSRGRAAT